MQGAGYNRTRAGEASTPDRLRRGAIDSPRARGRIPRVKVINVHAHLWAHQVLEERVEHYSIPGVVRTCLCGGNDKVLLAAEKYPDFVIPLAKVADDDVTAEAVERFHFAGFRGLKMIGLSRAYDDTGYYGLYEAAESLEMPILFHTGFLSIKPAQRRGTVSMLKMRPGTLDTLGRAFPDLKMMGAHLGAPWFLEACSVATQHANVYFDLSGGTVRRHPGSFYRLIFSRQADVNLRLLDDRLDERVLSKLVFGSDNPHPSVLLEFYLNLFDLLGVPGRLREKVLYSNAATIFGVD